MSYTKAYSFAEYFEASKKNFAKYGVNVAEEILESIVKAQYYTTKEWLIESAKLTSTPFDDLAMTQLSQFDAAVEAIKIDINKDGI